MVSRHMREPDELYWSEVTMAILNGGAIRGSINQGISCRYLLNSHVFGKEDEIVYPLQWSMQDFFDGAAPDPGG